jgi:threonine aldolase
MGRAMDKKTSDRFFNLRVKEQEDLESRMVRYYADFLIICALLLLCGIGGAILYAIVNGGSS